MAKSKKIWHSRKGNASKTAPLQKEEAKKLLSIKDERKRLLFALGIYMGLRASELTGLRWMDVLGKRVARIYQKKTGKYRECKIPAKIQELIEEFYDGQDLGAYLFYPLRGGDKSKPMTVHGLNKLLKQAMNELGVDFDLNSSSHLLRKTFGRTTYVHMKEKHGELAAAEALRKIYGHASITTTLRYIGMYDALIDEAEEAIDFL